MKKTFVTIESRDLLFIIRHGYILCVALMIFGAVVTAVWSNNLRKTIEPPKYNRSIYINLSGISGEHMRSQFNDDTQVEEESPLSEKKK